MSKIAVTKDEYVYMYIKHTQDFMDSKGYQHVGTKERIDEKMRLVKNTCQKSWIYELLNAYNHKNSISNYVLTFG